MLLSAYFSKYFVRNFDFEKEGPEFVFNCAQLKALEKSFLDSIVVELCLPGSQFPDYILCSLLHDAANEQKTKHLGVLSQPLCDAIGDLSVSFALQMLKPSFSHHNPVWSIRLLSS